MVFPLCLQRALKRVEAASLPLSELTAVGPLDGYVEYHGIPTHANDRDQMDVLWHAKLCP